MRVKSAEGSGCRLCAPRGSHRGSPAGGGLRARLCGADAEAAEGTGAAGAAITAATSGAAAAVAEAAAGRFPPPQTPSVPATAPRSQLARIT